MAESSHQEGSGGKSRGLSLQNPEMDRVVHRKTVERVQMVVSFPFPFFGAPYSTSANATFLIIMANRCSADR